jgi:hypothetical protein
MKSIVFSIFIDIPENKLDNPGWYENGIQVKTDKSLKTKLALLKNHDSIVVRHKEYSNTIGADYKLFKGDIKYQEFFEMFESDYPEISHYDIVNFYKHWLMKELANDYDQICYLDFDVIPNTDDSIFDKHDIKNKFGCAHSNKLAEWGKNISPKAYNTCIRNPSTKYWNAHAMLLESGYEPDNDVFNTGIMVASSKVIKDLGYFENFRENLNLMTELKTDEDSMYPYNIRRVFGYDNETLFSYLVHSKNIPIEYLNGPWHYIVDEKKKSKNACDPKAKMYHCINKKMEWFL